MAIRTGEYFTRPQETWTPRQCELAAKRFARDGMGTKYPWPGYIGSTHCPVSYGGYGTTRFNGGCCHGGDWYEGEIRLLPVVARGFQIIRVPSWGFRIVTTS